MKIYGLIGFPLAHSFSPIFFQNKFEQEGIKNAVYRLFPLPQIDDFPDLIHHTPDLVGLNVTIPYKEAIIPYLSRVAATAQAVGAVNVVRILRTNGELQCVGYNSDVVGFEQSLCHFMQPLPERALILGTGGAAKAVAFVLQKLNISYRFVSRKKDFLSYDNLTSDLIRSHRLIVNATPLGRFPDVTACPPIPYHYLTENHYLFDLNYNPSETLFMSEGKKYHAKTCNGLEMLQVQALESWRIWQLP